MKSFIKVIVLISISLFILLGCEKKKKEIVQKTETPTVTNNELENKTPRKETVIEKQDDIDEKIADDIIAVIFENLNATKAEDIERVLATLYLDNLERRSTMKGMEFVFANYDLEYVLEEVEVIEITGDEAKVYYIQTTRALRGIGFTNMRTQGVHHMIK